MALFGNITEYGELPPQSHISAVNAATIMSAKQSTQGGRDTARDNSFLAVKS